MRAFTCPVCGGKLNIKIGTEYAACDSCGNVTKIDPREAERFTRIYQAARRSMGLNSVEGYEAALRELDTISFIEEARKTRTDCERRLRDLQADLLFVQQNGIGAADQAVILPEIGADGFFRSGKQQQPPHQVGSRQQRNKNVDLPKAEQTAKAVKPGTDQHGKKDLQRPAVSQKKPVVADFPIVAQGDLIFCLKRKGFHDAPLREPESTAFRLFRTVFRFIPAARLSFSLW